MADEIITIRRESSNKAENEEISMKRKYHPVKK